MSIGGDKTMKDIIVIGGGPGGYVAAIRAAQLGLDTVVVEKEHFGGVCLNKGCIPTKALLQSADLLESIKSAADFGINVKGFDVDVNTIQTRKAAIINRLVSGIKYLLRENKVETIEGEAKIIDKNTVLVDGEKTIQAKNIIIATGSSIAKPPIDGMDNDNVIFSDEALNLSEIPKSIAIIGGGVIGIEFASYFNAMGAEVCVVEMLENIIPNADGEISSEMAARLRKRGIKILTGTQVKKILPDGIIVAKDGKEEKINSEKVLVSVGRTPDTSGIDCEKLGIKKNGRAIATDKNFATSIPNIYAIGDVIGGMMLAHKASAEGIAVVEHIAGLKHRFNADNIPSCVYSSPEIAFVGKTEELCKKENIKYKVGKFFYEGNGKALVEGQKGFIKVIVSEEYGEILGVHIIGKYACEMIMQGSIARTNELTAEELVYTIFPHPSVSEIFNEAFSNALGRAIHSKN